MIFFTADEHYYHTNIIKYCNRPFNDVNEMNNTLISNHNSIVSSEDTVYHLGDFCFLKKYDQAREHIILKLNGKHIFLQGSHDKWLPTYKKFMEEIKIENKLIVLCHYAMATWRQSHFNSWHLYGHSHGKFINHGKSYDVGVDNNNFNPVSFEEIKLIMAGKPDNKNIIKTNR